MNNEFFKYATKHVGLNTLGLEQYISKINNSGYISPTVIEERQLNVAQMDVFSRLMMDRIIFLGTAIDDYVANIIQAQLLFLESTDSKRDIQIYLNSPGGSVYAGLGIYDTMQFISPDVATICTGMAASMAAVLMCAGTAGKRSALLSIFQVDGDFECFKQPVGSGRGIGVLLDKLAKLLNHSRSHFHVRRHILVEQGCFSRIIVIEQAGFSLFQVFLFDYVRHVDFLGEVGDDVLGLLLSGNEKNALA